MFKIQWGITTNTYDNTTCKDAIIIGNRMTEWNWQGTSHKTGISLNEIKSLIDNGIRRIILSRGMHEKLLVNSETSAILDKLVEDGKIDEYVFLQSEEAITKYNNWIENNVENIGAFIHSTC